MSSTKCTWQFGQELCFSYVDPYQTDEERQATLELFLATKTCSFCGRFKVIGVA